jgi:DegV family protein with EDD domain
MTRIVVDSTLDLPDDQIKDNDIVVVPLNVHFGDESFKDKVDLSTEEFFERLAKVTQLPTTSQPSPGEFIEAYRAIPDGEAIVSIHIAGQLSGTVDSARLAAKELPDREIHIIDSGNVTWAAGLLAVLAAEKVREGLSAADVVKAVEEAKPRARLVAILDTLKYAIMGGRVSRLQGAVGGLLRVKPLLSCQEGVVGRLPPARTWGQAIDKVVDDIKQRGGAERMAVINTTAPEATAQLKARLEEEFGADGILEGTLGAVVGTYAGPGAAGVGYIGKKAVK